MIDLPALSSDLTQSELQLLKELTECVGVSGGEGRVRRLIQQALPAGLDELQVDALGNLTVRRRGRAADRLRVMVAAHMDEVGFMVVAADEDARLRFETVGGILESQLAGRAVWLGPERIPGVIGATPPHWIDSEAQTAPLSARSLRIDIGAASCAEALARVPPGTLGTLASPFECQDGMLRGKALDDRLGVATLLSLLGPAYAAVDLFGAFTTQEEIGLRGAGVAAHRLRPDLAIAIDCTPARDLPSADGEDNPLYNARLGDGAALYSIDASTVSDPKLLFLAQSVAERLSLPFQYRQPGGGSTDAGAIHRAQAGIPSLSISVPGRNLHGGISTARVSDWRAQCALVQGMLEELSPASWAKAGTA